MATENSLAGGATPIPSDEILGNIVATSPEFAEYHLRRSFWILRELGEEPLLSWCKDKPDRMKHLLSLGANVNAIDPRDGQTTLHSVFTSSLKSSNQEESVRLLMQYGADPMIPDNNGQTAIDWLNERISRAEQAPHGFKKAQQLRETLSLITGEAVEAPPWDEMSKYSATVRPELAECLMVEPADLEPKATFFDDLNGCTRSLRDFVFRIQNRLNVSIQPVLDAVFELVEIDNDGLPTGESLERLRSYLPDWKPKEKPDRFTDLFTVSLLELIVQKSANFGRKEPRGKADPKEVTRRARQTIASLANTSVDSLTPRTNLADLGVGVQYLGAIFSTLDNDFEIDCISVMRQVESQFEFDADGRLLEDCCERVVRLLPEFDASQFEDLTVDDVLMSVAGIEAMAAVAFARRREGVAPDPQTESWLRPTAEPPFGRSRHQ